MPDLRPPSNISIEQVRDLAARLMADLKEERDVPRNALSGVGGRVRDWFTEYEYSIYTEAYNAGYDDGNVDGAEHVSGVTALAPLHEEQVPRERLHLLHTYQKAGRSWLPKGEE